MCTNAVIPIAFSFLGDLYAPDDRSLPSTLVTAAMGVGKTHQLEIYWIGIFEYIYIDIDMVPPHSRWTSFNSVALHELCTLGNLFQSLSPLRLDAPSLSSISVCVSKAF